jgi:membrane-bound lytic murein transglycosylase B
MKIIKIIRVFTGLSGYDLAASNNNDLAHDNLARAQSPQRKNRVNWTLQAPCNDGAKPNHRGTPAFPGVLCAFARETVPTRTGEEPIIKIIIKSLVIAGLFLQLALPATVKANYAQRDDVKEFINEMIKKHHFDRNDLEQWFSKAKKLDGVLESISKPAEKILTWKQYRPIFIKQKRIRMGREFMKKHHDLLARAEKETGVPAHIIAAVIGVETYYGRHRGRTSVFDSLTTLGFDYPPRSNFFKNELEQFLLLAREEDIDVSTIRGSYAGAMGMPQFISSSYRRYAVDFDGDGKRDLWNSEADVIGSVANYFKVHGWQRDGDVIQQARVSHRPKDATREKLRPHTSIGDFRKQGVITDKPYADDVMATLITLEGAKGTEYWFGLKNFYVITRYNHSALYAMAVYELSQKLEGNS